MSDDLAHVREAAVGDWLEEPTVEGGHRRGLVVAVLGRPGHRHYLMRWDEEHESVHFPSSRARVIAADDHDR
ncbi:MAG: DUF1918 domain-containing protein [Solirubrobacteraceae bacterium]|nr:DUF1918 domain-containing protein [Solirubrobacteraceae bacterium]